jgi:hypothetical protein
VLRKTTVPGITRFGVCNLPVSRQDFDAAPAITWVVNIIAYETQARYAAGEAWITLDVCICRRSAIDEVAFRRDSWGRRPIEHAWSPSAAADGRSRRVNLRWRRPGG